MPHRVTTSRQRRNYTVA